ncbi:response regulator transcription factor [Paenibacillus sp. MAH-36]|uniref:Response regulator n=1 Tax=Paenibacillus violae TaxID=3077234 RepID=A0ABU3RCS8_9BACL|nr:response regulator [Paenibacillus sp. PFR10]MDU0202071.1 response regulator [Paenibacillus sp. PFR10]
MLKVLIADDEPIMLEGLRLLVDWHKLGFEIYAEALDGEDALQLVEENCPHLIITDIRMPVIDGLELIEKVYMRFPDTKFIVLSGYADFQYAQQAMKFGVSNYLTKPLDESELERAVHEVAEDIHAEETRRALQRSIIDCSRAETVSRLLMGDVRKEWVDKARSLLKLHEQSRIRCIYLVCSNLEDREQEQISLFQRLRVAGESEALTEVSVYPFVLGTNRYGFILAMDSKESVLTIPFIDRFVSHIQKECGENFSFAISSEVKGVLSLSRAYQEVLTAEVCKYPSNLPKVYYYHDKMSEESSSILEVTKASLIHAINYGNVDAVHTLMIELFITLSSSEAWAAANLSTLKLEILQELAQQGADIENWTRRWFASPLPKNLGELKSRLLKEFLEAAEWNVREKGARIDDLVSAAEAYVKQHYQGKLQLQHVAEYLHVNAAHLGQRFKKQRGLAFNEYVHTVRITEAKKLLLRTEMKITEIAQMVGYSDPEQFGAKFKALTGVIPSSYKKAEK